MDNGEKRNKLDLEFDTITQKYSFWEEKWFKNNDEAAIEKFKQELRERIEFKLKIIDAQSEI